MKKTLGSLPSSKDLSPRPASPPTTAARRRCLDVVAFETPTSRPLDEPRQRLGPERSPFFKGPTLIAAMPQIP